MASSFGGTIKLTGESQYQKSLKAISENLKVLSSEMRVVTSRYDVNDRSTSNLSQQNEILTKKIDFIKDLKNYPSVKMIKRAYSLGVLYYDDLTVKSHFYNILKLL